MVKYVDPGLEMDFRHLRFNVHRLYLAVHCVSMFLFLLGLFFASRPLLANLHNFELRVPGLVEARAAKGFHGRISFEEILDAKEEGHPLHTILMKQSGWNVSWISYDFGSFPHSYCWLRNDRLKVPTLPSLLRIVEYSGKTQLLIRVAIFVTIGIRFFFSIVSGNLLWHRLGQTRSVKTATVLLSVTDLLWLCFATLVLCIQQDVDHKIKWSMYFNLPLFGFFFVVHSVIYIVLSTAALKRTVYQCIQLACILAFTATFPRVYEGYLPFLEQYGKPCYADVPQPLALLEYTSLLSVIVFLSAQYWELVQVVGCVTVTQPEYLSYFVSTEEYSPWFASQIQMVPCKTVATLE